jgi:hypothetical protein
MPGGCQNSCVDVQFNLSQYFGYLGRNPNDKPGANFDGYNFSSSSLVARSKFSRQFLRPIFQSIKLNKLNSFNGNYINAEMVKAFITSSEYQQRFGP